MEVTLQPCLCAAKFVVGGCLLRSAVLKAIKPWCGPQVGLNSGESDGDKPALPAAFLGWFDLRKKIDLEIIEIKSDLVGGLNPFEKYQSSWIISPGRSKNKKYLKPPPSDM